MAEDNASLFARLWAELQERWTPKGVQYTSTIDVKDIIGGDVPELFVSTQENKPSPVGPYRYDDLLGIKNKLPTKGLSWERSYVGWTNSMEPTIDYGDMVIRCSYADWKEKVGPLRIGQVAVYQHKTAGRIIHRLIGRTPEGKYVFKGDNNKKADPPVDESAILDVVWFTIPTIDKVLEAQD